MKKDQIVEKGDIIGNTGKTGLAGGDHLHLGMMVHNTFVNPVEWWDKAWIEERIMKKSKYSDLPTDDGLITGKFALWITID